MRNHTVTERREHAAAKLSGDYYSIAWYLSRLDELQESAEAQGKHPAAVSAIRTMAELVGLLGPQTVQGGVNVQVLQLPEGLSEAAILALASGSYNEESVSSTLASFEASITPE